MSAALEKTGQVLTVLSEQLEATGDELRKRADGEESVRKRADAALQVCPLPPPPCRARPVGVILGHSTLATAPWPQHRRPRSNTARTSSCRALSSRPRLTGRRR